MFSIIFLFMLLGSDNRLVLSDRNIGRIVPNQFNACFDLGGYRYFGSNVPKPASIQTNNQTNQFEYHSRKITLKVKFGNELMNVEITCIAQQIRVQIGSSTFFIDFQILLEFLSSHPNDALDILIQSFLKMLPNVETPAIEEWEDDSDTSSSSSSSDASPEVAKRDEALDALFANRAFESDDYPRPGMEKSMRKLF